ncbi:hypothetical protein TNCV_1446711 [Trichonephila clavipes]|nr:hypothetical protein TNCV_1446711 [Trichonephila clavipes]
MPLKSHCVEVLMHAKSAMGKVLSWRRLDARRMCYVYALNIQLKSLKPQCVVRLTDGFGERPKKDHYNNRHDLSPVAFGWITPLGNLPLSAGTWWGANNNRKQIYILQTHQQKSIIIKKWELNVPQLYRKSGTCAPFQKKPSDL